MLFVPSVIVICISIRFALKPPVAIPETIMSLHSTVNTLGQPAVVYFNDGVVTTLPVKLAPKPAITPSIAVADEMGLYSVVAGLVEPNQINPFVLTPTVV